jgi:hypothetical protein
MRAMETLIDVNHALSQDLPTGHLKRPLWFNVASLVVQAAETGRDRDIQLATNMLVLAIEFEGWMKRAARAA